MSSDGSRSFRVGPAEAAFITDVWERASKGESIPAKEILLLTELAANMLLYLQQIAATFAEGADEETVH